MDNSDKKKINFLKHKTRTKSIFRPKTNTIIRNFFFLFSKTDKYIYNYPDTDFLADIPDEFIRLDPNELEYLFIVASHSKKSIVEIGRFNGGSLLVFALANKIVPIYSIDNNPKDDNKLRNIFKEMEIGNNVNLIVGDSQNTHYDKINNYDFLFIDGDHSYNGCLNDLNNWWDKLEVGGDLILHDSYFGSEVQNAILDFCRSKKEKITTIVSPINFGKRDCQKFKNGSLCHLKKSY